MRRSGSEVDPELERLVDDWQKRRAEMLLGKRHAKDMKIANVPQNIIVSRRRGERRLVSEILHKNTEATKAHEEHGKRSTKS